MTSRCCWLILATLFLWGCESSSPDAVSEASRQEHLELPVGHPDRVQAELAIAEQRFRADPQSETAAIWYGRRLAYAGRIDEAIDVYTQALEVHPRSARLLRHRGHRYLSRREFERAERDLQRAAQLCENVPDEIEPDGMPNPEGRPRSTTQGNIWYHLALSHFYQGDFPASAEAWRRALELSTNDDTLVAVTHWSFMTLRRLGDEHAAKALLDAIEPDMEILENDAYHQVLLLKKGARRLEEVLAGETQLQRETAGFGVAHWLLMNGEDERARKLLDELRSGPPSNAFGRIAAEVEWARLTGTSDD